MKSLKPLSAFKSRKTYFFIMMALISRYDRARARKCWVIDIQRWCMRITGLSLDSGEKKNPISMLTQTDLNLYEIWHISSHVKGPPVCNICHPHMLWGTHQNVSKKDEKKSTLKRDKARMGEWQCDSCCASKSKPPSSVPEIAKSSEKRVCVFFTIAKVEVHTHRSRRYYSHLGAFNQVILMANVDCVARAA